MTELLNATREEFQRPLHLQETRRGGVMTYLLCVLSLKEGNQSHPPSTQRGGEKEGERDNT